MRLNIILIIKHLFSRIAVRISWNEHWYIFEKDGEIILSVVATVNFVEETELIALVGEKKNN